ncbi:MAG: 2-C-methyl-D-erythritol 4-phosphate cytidylyltransferase [Acidobacteriota bacterium]
MIGLILAAAGSGSRFGSHVPKQFLYLHDTPVYQHALTPFVSLCSPLVVVVPSAWKHRVSRELQSAGFPAIVTSGGEERQDSVYRGFCELGDNVDLVLVHDAARPFVSTSLISRVIEQAGLTGACVPGVQIAETVKEIEEEGKVVRTLRRESLRLIQTPQGFGRALLGRALAKALREDVRASDEAVLIERLGMPVQVIPGEISNVKITWPEDGGGLMLAGDLGEAPSLAGPLVKEGRSPSGKRR